MSHSSDLDTAAKLYLLDAIDPVCYDNEAATHAELISFVAETFESEAGFNVARVGQQKAMAEWFAGLPSVISVDFNYTDIIAAAVKMGGLPAEHTEAHADRIIANWFNFMAAKFCQLISGYRVPKDTTERTLERIEAYQESVNLPCTEAEVSRLFDENILPLILEQYSATDGPAISEGFNNWTDSITRDGELNELQYNQYCYVGSHANV